MITLDTRWSSVKCICWTWT